jgi:hypothetical protein
MISEYEDALSEMNTILEKENEDLHAKVNALETELEALNEKGNYSSTPEIRGKNCTIRVSTDMLVDFYQKAQPLIIMLAKEARISTSDLVRKFDIDLRFGEREVNDHQYAKRKYSYSDMEYDQYHFSQELAEAQWRRYQDRFLNSPK